MSKNQRRQVKIQNGGFITSYDLIYPTKLMLKRLNPIQTGGGGRLTTPQTKILYYSRTITSTVFLLRDFSSNLRGNNLVLLGFGS